MFRVPERRKNTIRALKHVKGYQRQLCALTKAQEAILERKMGLEDFLSLLNLTCY